MKRAAVTETVLELPRAVLANLLTMAALTTQRYVCQRYNNK